MSKRSSNRKRRDAREKRRKNRWKLVIRHAKCKPRQGIMKNWGYDIKSVLAKDRIKWSTWRCMECGLRYKIENNENKDVMRVLGCGTFTLPIDAIQLLAAIGQTA